MNATTPGTPAVARADPAPGTRIGTTPRILLFDDVADPDTLANIAGEHPDVVQRLGAAITAWHQSTGPVLPPKSQ